MSGRAPGPVVDHHPNLLDSLAQNALDDDYYEVRPGRYASRGLAIGSVAVIVAFAAMVTIAAVQTRDELPQRQVARETLVSDIQSRKATLAARRADARSLTAEVASLRAAAGSSDPDYTRLQVLAAERAVDGPGVVVTVDDASDAVRVSDRDLLLLVNGLWGAGAEAVAVNGHRLGSLSAIHQAGGAITVNYASVNPPYTVEAVGDGSELADRFASSPYGAYWALLEEDPGMKFKMKRADELSLAAVPFQRLSLAHAKALRGAS